jgi:hypothetical protein
MYTKIKSLVKKQKDRWRWDAFDQSRLQEDAGRPVMPRQSHTSTPRISDRGLTLSDADYEANCNLNTQTVSSRLLNIDCYNTPFFSDRLIYDRIML